MDNPIISTKGTNQTVRTIAIVISAISVILLFAILIIVYGKINSYPSIYRSIVMRKYIPIIIFDIVGCIFAFIAGALLYALCRSYADVYNDRVEGKGIQDGTQVVDFNLTYDIITSVTYVRTSLFFNTSSGKYAVITNSSTAKKIFDFYNQECRK